MGSILVQTNTGSKKLFLAPVFRGFQLIVVGKADCWQLEHVAEVFFMPQPSGLSTTKHVVLLLKAPPS